MYTPIKPKAKLLNGSFSPFMSPAISKVSTACDLLREQRNQNSKKRFARKRQASNESLKRNKPSGIQCKGYNNQQPFGSQNVSECTGKCEKVVPELIFKRNSILTSKYLKISTDRSSNNGNFPQNCNILHNGLQTSRDHTRKTLQFELEGEMRDDKMQLQIKNGQMMILEDENVRMRRDLEQKQQVMKSLQVQNKHLSQQIQILKVHHQERIQQLQIQLKQRDQQLVAKAQLFQRKQKILSQVSEKLKQSQNQVQLLKLHLQQLISKQLSQSTLQLISYRQLSLYNQLLQLRNDFERLKTDQHRNIQLQFHKISEQLTFVSKDCQHLSIANRILNKKNKEIEMSIEKKYKSQLTQVKEKLRNLIKETAVLKKENVTLRKTIHIHEKNHGLSLHDSNSRQVIIKRPNRLVNPYKPYGQALKQLDSDDSFTISLSK